MEEGGRSGIVPISSQGLQKLSQFPVWNPTQYTLWQASVGLLQVEGPYETRQPVPTEAILDQPAAHQPGSAMQTHDWAQQRQEEMPNRALHTSK